jgi:signal peptide peptidase SppA
MKYPLISHKLHKEPWMVRPDVFESMVDVLASALRGHTAGPVSLVDRVMEDNPRDNDQGPVPFEYMVAGGVAVVPVQGILGKHLSAMETLCGGCSLDQLEVDLQRAEADPGVRSILLRMDTPGGQVTGTPEVAESVAQIARFSKPVVAWTDSQMCSGGYYIGSQATRVAASGSAIVGSVGVIMSLMDASEALERQGIKYHVYTTGELKALGNPSQPITQKQHEWILGFIEQTFAEFQEAVLSGRGPVGDAVWDAGVFRTSDAIGLNLVDVRLDSLDEALEYTAAQERPNLVAFPGTY